MAPTKQHHQCILVPTHRIPSNSRNIVRIRRRSLLPLFQRYVQEVLGKATEEFNDDDVICGECECKVRRYSRRNPIVDPESQPNASLGENGVEELGVDLTFYGNDDAAENRPLHVRDSEITLGSDAVWSENAQNLDDLVPHDDAINSHELDMEMNQNQNVNVRRRPLHVQDSEISLGSENYSDTAYSLPISVSDVSEAYSDDFVNGSLSVLHIGSQQEVPDTQSSSLSTVVSLTSSSSSTIFFQHIQSVTQTQTACFICGSTEDRKTLPWSSLRQVWYQLNVYVPKSNRACRCHFTQDRKLFTEDALKQIEAIKQGIRVKSIDLGLWVLEMCEPQPKKAFTFDEGGITPDKYRCFTGLEKADFDNLHTKIKDRLRNSCNRSTRDVLGMFLMVLRTRNTQEFIGNLFDTTQRVVSEAVESALLAVEEIFVPYHIGYLHETRDEAISKHNIKLCNALLGHPQTSLAVHSDATYIYIEQPCEYCRQRKTWCPFKKRNLLKILAFCYSDGYIMEVAGPYYCDFQNNDAECLRHHIDNSDLNLFLEPEDFFVLDRGFRDVVDKLTEEGFSVHMPALLKDAQTFNCEEGNETRKVTVNRWIIEAAHAHVKNIFPFFRHTVEGRYVPKIFRFYRAACAMINCYRPVLLQDKDFHTVIIEAATSPDLPSVNSLKQELEEKRLIRMTTRWERLDATSVPQFPKILEIDQLKTISLGPYQIREANKYNKQHRNQDGRYEIFIHEEAPDLVRGQIRSRFSNSRKQNVWIKYLPGGSGQESIIGRYCGCKNGERMLGCCAHTMAIIKFFAYDRHRPPTTRRRRPTYDDWGVIDCGEVNEDDD